MGSGKMSVDVAGILKEIEGAGLSERAFAEAIGVPPSTLSYWLRRQRLEEELKGKNGGTTGLSLSKSYAEKTVADAAVDPGLPEWFVPVEMCEESEGRNCTGLLRVELINGRCLEIPEGYDPDSLAELVEVLESMP